MSSPTFRPSVQEKWWITFSTGFALFFVLYVYQGYNIQKGVSFSGHGLLFRAVSFGLLTSLSFFLHEFWLREWLSIKTLWQEILWTSWEIFITATFTFLLFNYFWNGTEWYWSGYFLMLFECTCVVIFPILLVRKLSRSDKKQVPAPQGQLLFASENGKHQLSLQADKLLFIKSADNYVEIFYLSHDELRTTLQRNSLKNIAEQLADHPYLQRCHRSYMVNISKINHVTFAQRQMQLDLGHGQIIPVSQKYQNQFQQIKASVHSSLN